MRIARIIDRMIGVPVALGLALGVSCNGNIGDRPCTTVSDPGFDGIWRAFDQQNSITVELNVSHSGESRCDPPEGIVRAHGFNNLADSDWQLVTFTGKVVQVGLTRGLLQLWSEGPDLEVDPEPVAEIPDQEIRRDESTRSLELRLNYSGRQERFILVKQ